ncbi:MAG: insulinase family protein [Clostridia bacterium]
MLVNQYIIGIKDTIPKEKMEKREIVKREISMQIILELLLGNSSELYQKMYKEGVIYRGIGYSYDLAKNYANILISGQSDNPERVYELIKEKIKEFKQEGINEEDFNRIKKKIYGEYIQEYNDVSSIARMFLADYFKGVNSFDYVEEIEHINKDELLLMLKDVFKEDKMVISIVRN